MAADSTVRKSSPRTSRYASAFSDGTLGSPRRSAIRLPGDRPPRPAHLQRQWSIPLSIGALWALIVRLDHCIRPYSPSVQAKDDVMLAVIEALSNALSGARQAAPGSRIVVRLRVSSRAVSIDVKDPGGGFAHHLRPRQLVQPEREGGRGLYLIEQIMDEVSWSPIGNAIHMTRWWAPKAA